MKERIALVALMLVAVPLSGEFKFFPFTDKFRISMGTPVFFFFLLWVRRVPPVLSGLLAGTSVIVFRVALTNLVDPAAFRFGDALQFHAPGFFYYFTFGLLFQLLRFNRFEQRPLLLGIWGVLAETGANVVELAIRHKSAAAIPLVELNLVVLVAIFRSFFAVGFFHILKYQQVKAVQEQQRKQNEHLLMLISSLYEESFHLKKTLQQAEDITRNCYELYQRLKNSQLSEWAGQALRIAGEVHEIKKDTQRIYAGISEIISGESLSDYMSADELGGILVRSSQKYARLLGKEVRFTLSVEGPHPPYHAFLVLSLLNNLTANAVEAIRGAGEVGISIAREGEWVRMQVEDSGSGISPKHRQMIFEPGFTTKYDTSGRPSTGIGLYYVKETAEQLGGRVEMREHPRGKGAVFVLQLPVFGLTRRMEE